ncbi:S26 family signal peptidase, partial [Flavihumibacter sediminis]|nr:S26 family signal peptidase [Flavihumibacter sediminis]
DLQKEESTKNSSPVGAIGLFLLELIKVAILAGITIWLVRHFLFKPFYVKGQSMEPTFYAKEYLIIDELSYRLREPERGEVIVLREPLGSHEEFYLKR